MVEPISADVSARRWVAACLLVVAIPILVVLAGDARVNSGSDAGGKTATVANIAEHGTSGVDLGYWAESVDPDGVHHPVINTERRDEGWIQVTSAAMPLASAAGERVAGPIGALWLAFLAVPLGALAAARMSRQLGAKTGMVAFVVAGAFSPLGFYGADQWEHAPALALGLWAFVLLRERLGVRGIVLLGLIAGAATVLRRETALFLFVAVLFELADPDRRRWWLSRVPQVALGAMTALGVIVGVGRLDSALLGATLANRSSDQVAGAGSNLSQRLHDGVLTTVSQYSNLSMPWILFGTLAFVGVAISAWGWRVDDAERVRMGGLIVAASIVVRLMVGGMTFVSGAFAVLPLTAATPILAGRPGRRLAATACGAVVLIVALQWTGSHAAQWGGRYLLLPALVVAIAAATAIEKRGWREPAALVALGATAVVALLGLAWHAERTNEIATSRDEVLSITDGEVVISTHSHFGREVAVDLLDQRWLWAATIELIEPAFEVANAAAPGESVWLLHPGTCTQPCTRLWADRSDTVAPIGWRSTEIREVDWIIGTYVLERFEPA